MKIGIYCGLANNMYVFAHSLARQGIDVCFIRDRSDRYPMSQPIWEDLPFRLGYEEVPLANSWSWEKWTQFEKGKGWIAPQWHYDPLKDSNGTAISAKSRSKGIWNSLVLNKYIRQSNRVSVLRRMQTCDVLLVSGIEGSLLANASGLPYIIWPFGGDIMIAAGLLRPKRFQVRARVRQSILASQLVAAYDNAVCVGAHEPTALTTDFYGAEHFLRRYKMTRIPIPYSKRPRPAKESRRENLQRVLKELGFELPSNSIVGFVPSRVDYEWKGQDRVLNAVAALAKKGQASNIHLIFSGWGKDFGSAIKFVKENNLGRRFTFLDCALSKPLLYRFFLNADFVVDQFIVGILGTSALEAISCGAPLVTWVNQSVIREWGQPPVIQAKSEDDVRRVLLALSEEKIDLDSTGARLQEWLDANYNPAKAAYELLAAFDETEKI